MYSNQKREICWVYNNIGDVITLSILSESSVIAVVNGFSHSYQFAYLIACWRALLPFKELRQSFDLQSGSSAGIESDGFFSSLSLALKPRGYQNIVITAVWRRLWKRQIINYLDFIANSCVDWYQRVVIIHGRFPDWLTYLAGCHFLEQIVCSSARKSDDRCKLFHLRCFNSSFNLAHWLYSRELVPSKFAICTALTCT